MMPDAPRMPDGPRLPDGPVGPDAPAGVAVTGKAIYQKRTPTPMGLAQTTTPTPIRGADVELVDATDRAMVVGTGKTDAMGLFQLAPNAGTTLAPGRMLVVRLLGRARGTGWEVDVYEAAATRVLYAVSSEPFAVAAGAAVVNFDVDATPGTGRAGAFNILDNCRHEAEFLIGAIGGELGTLPVFWAPGNNPVVHISHFSRGDGGLHIQGGDPGMFTSSDTDEFDDAVMTHEFAHFFQAKRAFTVNPGGQHGGEYLLPHFAWAEGSATFVGAISRGDGTYIDTYGVGAGGGIFYNTNLDTSKDELPQGIGSEETVQAVMWDLVDGASGLPDADMDLVKLPVNDVVKVLADLSPMSDFPTLPTVLERVMALPAAPPAAALNALLTAPQDRKLRWPLGGEDQAPKPLPIGAAALLDTVDAVTNPPAVGGRRNASNGYLNQRYYRLVVDQPRMVTLTLTITGTGTASDGTDLELSLRENDDRAIATSDMASPTEAITQMLQPGRYLVRVSGYKSPTAAFKAAYTLGAM